jgi:KUP system potassium uptake protein
MYARYNDIREAEMAVGGLDAAALGIVFGDIGTSPLYTLKTVLDLTGGTPTPASSLASSR